MQVYANRHENIPDAEESINNESSAYFNIHVKNLLFIEQYFMKHLYRDMLLNALYREVKF